MTGYNERKCMKMLKGTTGKMGESEVMSLITCNLNFINQVVDV